MPGLDVEHAHQGKTSPPCTCPTTFRAQAFQEEVRRRLEQGKEIQQLRGPEKTDRLRQEQERQDKGKAAFEHLSAAEQRARKAKRWEAGLK